MALSESYYLRRWYDFFGRVMYYLTEEQLAKMQPNTLYSVFMKAYKKYFLEKYE